MERRGNVSSSEKAKRLVRYITVSTLITIIAALAIDEIYNPDIWISNSGTYWKLTTDTYSLGSDKVSDPPFTHYQANVSFSMSNPSLYTRAELTFPGQHIEVEARLTRHGITGDAKRSAAPPIPPAFP